MTTGGKRSHASTPTGKQGSGLCGVMTALDAQPADDGEGAQAGDELERGRRGASGQRRVSSPVWRTCALPDVLRVMVYTVELGFKQRSNVTVVTDALHFTGSAQAVRRCQPGMLAAAVVSRDDAIIARFRPSRSYHS